MTADGQTDCVVRYFAQVRDAASEVSLSQPTEQYRWLREGLLSGALPPGELLLESTISRLTGASRTPVRQALNHLEVEGFLERRTRGWRVRVGTPEEIIEIYETRIALEAYAARCAARRRTDLDLARLRSLRDVAAPASPGAHQANRSWHEAVWAAGHNRTVSAILRGLIAQLQVIEVAAAVAAENVERTNAEHERIFDAITARDEDAAEAAITAHLQRTLEMRVAWYADQSSTVPS